ncbi:MAG: hypothetical protein ACLRQF_18110 [Thomasclavelia ramosa]
MNLYLGVCNQHLNKDYIVKDKLVLWEGTPKEWKLLLMFLIHITSIFNVPTEF